MTRLLNKTSLLLLIAIVLAAMVVAYASIRHKAPPTAKSKRGRAMPSTRLATAVDVKGGLIIAVYPTGFRPPELDVVAGRYLVVVQNRSGIRDLTYRLDTMTGLKLQEITSQKLQWKTEFDLLPGTYVLSVGDHPTWRSVIRVKSL